MGKYSAKPQKTRGKKGLIVFLSAVLVIVTMGAAAAGIVALRYHIVDAKLYPKDATVLDLREESVKPKQIDKIREKMPDCEIRWNIPFQRQSGL